MANDQPMSLRVPDFNVVAGSPFKNDLLGRRPVIEDWTAHFIENVQGPCHLAVNGGYGTGKSAMLRMWAEHLRNEEERYYVVEINFWETAYLDNPLLALLAKMHDQSLISLKGDWPTKLLTMAGRGAIAAANVLLPGLPVADLAGASRSSDFNNIVESLKQFASYEKVLRDFDESIAKGLDERRLVVFADELDRCDAQYAVRCLEMVKLMFTSQKVVFVAGINLSQLDAAVHKCYGWDAQAYRRRFIDRVLDVPPPVGDTLKSYFNRIADTANLSEHLFAARQIVEDTLLGKPDESMNTTAEPVLATTVSLRELQQFSYRWIEVCSRLINDPHLIKVEKYLVAQVGTVLLIAKHLDPKAYQEMLEGSGSDAALFEAVNQALRSRAGIYTSQTMALLQAVLSLCTIVTAHGVSNHDFRILLDRGSLENVRPSQIWMNAIGEIVQANVPIYAQLPDSLYKRSLKDMAGLSFDQLDRIASTVEGYSSGALGK